MYGEQSASWPQKWFLVVLHGGAVLVSAWLLLGGGIEIVAKFFGSNLELAVLSRRALLLACSVIYFARVCGTVFVFLHRKMAWWEAATIGSFTWIINITFSLLGGTQPAPLGLADVVAVALYVAGSYLNTGSEYQRDRWKQRPENRGRLYTEGLFRWSMHINYFGDVMLFTGWALLTYRSWAFLLPLLMLMGFVFFHVPMLDKHLHEKYGTEFDQYRRRTKKLIPFLY
jgi:protein-S-isoprenylcysteine O-methyltransferase Ste14